MTEHTAQTAEQASKSFRLTDPAMTTKAIAKHLNVTVSDTFVHGYHPSILKASSGIVGIRLTADLVLIFDPFQAHQNKMKDIATQIVAD